MVPTVYFVPTVDLGSLKNLNLTKNTPFCWKRITGWSIVSWTSSLQSWASRWWKSQSLVSGELFNYPTQDNFVIHGVWMYFTPQTQSTSHRAKHGNPSWRTRRIPFFSIHKHHIWPFRAILRICLSVDDDGISFHSSNQPRSGFRGGGNIGHE